MKHKSAKRILLVNRDFQLRYTIAAVVVGALSSALSLFVILFPLYFFNIIHSIRFLPMPILLGIGVAVLINILALFGFGIVVSHRIAGPMYAIVRHLRRLGSGYFGVQMRQREGDELRYVVRNVNDLVESLKIMTKQDIDALDLALNKVESGNNTEATQDLKAIRERLHRRLEVNNVK